MELDNNTVAESLRRWEKYLNNYKLPKWGDIPNLGLYMEQVLQLLGEYLDYLPPELKKEQFLTAAAINNYVRKKYMPGPIKKKYYRTHIAYLILICSLKQNISITTLQNYIPVGMEETELHEFYDAYVERHKKVVGYFIDQVRKICAGILNHDGVKQDISADNAVELISLSAIISGFSGLLAEKLLLLTEKERKKAQENKETVASQSEENA